MTQIQKIDRARASCGHRATRFASPLQRGVAMRLQSIIGNTAPMIESEMFGDRCTQLHISRRRAPISTGAVGRNGIESAAQFGVAMRRVKSPRTSSGRKRDRGAIT